MNHLRISGIASGMDTETMVRDLMRAQRMQLDRFNQEKQLMLWRQEQYNDVNKDFANFIIDTRKELELVKITDSGITLSNNLSGFSWVKKTTVSDENILTATAVASAAIGSHKIRVHQLAEGANIGSIGQVVKSDNSAATATTKLEELGVAQDSSLAFEIQTEEGLKTVNISYKKTDTIADLVKKINTAATADEDPLGIQASFDNTAGRFFLSTKGTGSKTQIKVTSDDQGLLIGENNCFKIFDDLTKGLSGQDAKIDFDGAKDIFYTSNTFTLNGIQINLKALSANPDMDEFTIKVDTDVDSVYKKIQLFVEKYNEMIDKTDKKLSEKRYRDYLPLTDEQKEGMKDSDIEKWEERSKSGLLRNDSFINNTLAKIRTGLYEEVKGLTGSYNQLHQIGITTGDWKDRGKLVIDETKLKRAMIEDGEGVLQLMFSPSNEDDRSKSGLVNRLYDDMVVGMKDIIDKSGTGDNASLYRNVEINMLIDFVTDMGSISYLDKDVLNIEKQIFDEEDRLNRIEDSYWRKFTAMEKAISQMNSQSTWIAQQFGGGM
jgi:flagellar hook-associated protein 2